jgi:hypothetical protein
MWVRTTNSLSFFGNSRTLHDLVRPDHSSGLFPKESFQRFGAWDAVRISADTELYWRIEHALGNKKWMFNRRQVLKNCPLAFGRMSGSSLTQAGPTSVMTIYHGLRREYREAADFWHSQREKMTDSTPWARRKPFFQVPPLMDPSDDEKSTQLTILMIADWNSGERILGEVIRQVVQSSSDLTSEAKAGLLHYPRYHSNVNAPLNELVRHSAWENNIRVISPGETVEARAVIVVTSDVFEHAMDRFPELTFERLIVMACSTNDQSPTGGERDQKELRQQFEECFGQESEWLHDSDELLRLIRDCMSACKQRHLADNTVADERSASQA